jgi:TP901 family phage tail tape measure protein
MAIKIQELAFILNARDRLSPVLRKVTGEIERVNAAAKGTAWMREAAGNFAVMGAGALAAAGAIALPLAAWVRDASEVQDQLHRLANTLPAGAEGLRELAQAQAAAAKYSELHANSETDLLKAVYLGTSAGLKMNASIAGMSDAAALATGVGGDLETVQRTLNLAYINFRNPALSAKQNMQNLSDVMAKAAAAFDYKNVEELREQLELAAPTALVTGTSFKDLITILADFTRHGLTGTEAGTALEETLRGVMVMNTKLGIAQVRNSKGGIDLMRSLAALRQHYIGLYGSMKAIPPAVMQQIEKVLGIRGIRAFLLNAKEMEGMREQLNHVAGATQQFQAQMERAPSKQWIILANNIRQIGIIVGNALLPPLVKMSQVVVSVLRPLEAFGRAHPMLVKFIVTFAAIGAAVAAVAGGILVLGGGLLALGSFLPVGGAILGVVAGIGGALALAGAAWATFGNVVEKYVGGWSHWLHSAGAHLMDALAAGMKAKALAPIHEIEAVAHRIRSYLPFSPAEAGPLRDLHRVRIVQTIAESIKPAPMADAIRRVAQVAAVAVPLAIGGAVVPAMAAPMGRAGGGGSVVNVYYHVEIKGAAAMDGHELRRALSAHAYDLVSVIDRERERRGRARFEE